MPLCRLLFISSLFLLPVSVIKAEDLDVDAEDASAIAAHIIKSLEERHYREGFALADRAFSIWREREAGREIPGRWVGGYITNLSDMLQMQRDWTPETGVKYVGQPPQDVLEASRDIAAAVLKINDTNAVSAMVAMRTPEISTLAHQVVLSRGLQWMREGDAASGITAVFLAIEAMTEAMSTPKIEAEPSEIAYPQLSKSWNKPQPVGWPEITRDLFRFIRQSIADSPPKTFLTAYRSIPPERDQWDFSKKILQSAAVALAEFPDERALLFQAAMRDPRPELRIVVIQSLVPAGMKSRTPIEYWRESYRFSTLLRQHFDDPDPYVRLEISLILIDLSDPAGFEWLMPNPRVQDVKDTNWHLRLFQPEALFSGAD